ncbi:transmembrane protein 44 [Centroberyx gerrardi]
MYQRCKFRGENPGEAATSFYCFLGNLCSTIGAILSRQLDIQILMGAFAAAVDVVNFISIFFPICLCWNSKADRRLRMMRRRRRQHLLAVCVLMVLGGGFLTSRVEVGPRPAARPVSGRRMLHVPLQDNTEILGYTLGLLSFVIACTSKFPALSRAGIMFIFVLQRRTDMVAVAPVLSAVLCSLAGALYASAILLYHTEMEFVVRAMPWLLSAICCAALDLLILVAYWCRRGARPRPKRFCPDTESLLGDSGPPTKDGPAMKRQRKQQKKNIKKMTEMGHYMDVSVQPARKVSLQEVPVSREEAVEQQPLKGTVRMVRLDGLCSLDSSDDSSTVSSDLEWDFEEANAQWSEPPAKQEKGEEFPLQEWPKNPKPFSICTCGTSGLPEKTVSGREVGESGSAAGMAR